MVEASKSLVVAVCIPPGTRCWVWFTVFLGRGSSGGFHVAFPTMIALTPQVWEPVWGFCQLPRMSSKCTFWNWGINGWQGLGTYWIKNVPELKSTNHLTSTLPTLSDGWILWGLLRLVSVQGLCSVVPKMSNDVLFPLCTLILVKGCRFLWEND